MSYRCDFLICENNTKSASNFEYGASEADKGYNINGNKTIKIMGKKF
jgi:hypothetical protein